MSELVNEYLKEIGISGRVYLRTVLALGRRAWDVSDLHTTDMTIAFRNINDVHRAVLKAGETVGWQPIIPYIGKFAFAGSSGETLRKALKEFDKKRGNMLPALSTRLQRRLPQLNIVLSPTHSSIDIWDENMTVRLAYAEQSGSNIVLDADDKTEIGVYDGSRLSLDQLADGIVQALRLDPHSDEAERLLEEYVSALHTGGLTPEEYDAGVKEAKDKLLLIITRGLKHDLRTLRS